MLLLYRVIHKSVKHFKNSQQINYSNDHGSSYADRERNFPSSVLHISQLLNVSTFGNTADIYATSISFHTPVSCENLEISGEWRHKDSVIHKAPEKKKMSHGVKSGDRGGHRINTSSSFPVRPIHLCGKFRLRYPRTSM